MLTETINAKANTAQPSTKLRMSVCTASYYYPPRFALIVSSSGGPAARGRRTYAAATTRAGSGLVDLPHRCREAKQNSADAQKFGRVG